MSSQIISIIKQQVGKFENSRILCDYYLKFFVITLKHMTKQFIYVRHLISNLFISGILTINLFISGILTSNLFMSGILTSNLFILLR